MATENRVGERGGRAWTTAVGHSFSQNMVASSAVLDGATVLLEDLDEDDVNYLNPSVGGLEAGALSIWSVGNNRERNQSADQIIANVEDEIVPLPVEIAVPEVSPLREQQCQNRSRNLLGSTTGGNTSSQLAAYGAAGFELGTVQRYLSNTGPNWCAGTPSNFEGVCSRHAPEPGLHSMNSFQNAGFSNSGQIEASEYSADFYSGAQLENIVSNLTRRLPVPDLDEASVSRSDGERVSSETSCAENFAMKSKVSTEAEQDFESEVTSKQQPHSRNRRRRRRTLGVFPKNLYSSSQPSTKLTTEMASGSVHFAMDSENSTEDNDAGGAEILDDGEGRMDLTDDLLHKVFSFLNDTSLCVAAMVCRQWRNASAHEDFWKSLNFEGRKVSPQQVSRVCSRYPNAAELNLRITPSVDESVVQDALHSLRRLEALILGKATLSDSFFLALSSECRSLHTLSINEATLGYGGSQEIQLRHDSLKNLHILRCRVLRIAIRCPQLEVLSLKRTGAASAMLNCPRLLKLDVSSCHKLSDAGVRAAATACPLLINLDMSICSYVSDETLREISSTCTNLRSLNASFCPNISLEGVRMPALVELRLQSCEGINSSSMAALSHCFMLELLELDSCCWLTSVVLDLPHLRSISLSSCRRFVELTLRTPSLMEINVENCSSLNRIDITSTSIKKLALSQQQGLTTIALQCPWLREVDLTECDSLTNALCKVFSEGGGCPRLSTLILDSCEGLTAVTLTTQSLLRLSLVGCQKMCSLDLVCPNLEKLQLDGCDHLTTASFSPVGLQSLNLGICPHLSKLKIEATEMTVLDLRGCGVLSQAALCCPRLLSLDASYCSQLGDDCLAATANACPMIQSLILASCPSVGPVGLLALDRLHALTVLDLSYTFLTDLSPVFAACPYLEVLKLSACKYLANNALVALHGGKVLPSLRELDLSYGSLDRSAIEGLLSRCPHLTHISLNGCANVHDIEWVPGSFGKAADWDTHMESVDKISLDDVHMHDLADDEFAFGFGGVGMFTDVHTSLQKSPLASFNNGALGSGLPILVDDLMMQPGNACQDWEDGYSCRALQTLNCVGCPNIKRVVIPGSAQCFNLSSLNLSLSTNVREVQLECSNLIQLNLSNCVALLQLKLDCPRLISLCLQASGIDAEELECAIMNCSLLETLDVRNCTKVSVAALSRIRLNCPALKRLYSTIMS